MEAGEIDRGNNVRVAFFPRASGKEKRRGRRVYADAPRIYLTASIVGVSIGLFHRRCDRQCSSSRAGNSVRKWTPRDSVRTRPATADSREAAGSKVLSIT